MTLPFTQSLKSGLVERSRKLVFARCLPGSLICFLSSRVALSSVHSKVCTVLLKLQKEGRGGRGGRGGEGKRGIALVLLLLLLLLLLLAVVVNYAPGIVGLPPACTRSCRCVSNRYRQRSYSFIVVVAVKVGR